LAFQRKGLSIHFFITVYLLKKIRKQLVMLLLSGVVLLLHAFATQPDQVAVRVRERYVWQLATLQQTLKEFRHNIAVGDTAEWKAGLLHCRKAYKRAEIIIAYQYPLIAKRLNGPALMEAEITNPNESVMPTGFQVIEEALFEEEPLVQQGKLLKQVDHVIAYTSLLQKQVDQVVITGAALYDALKLNLCTMASLGLSGFDTPMLLSALDEAGITLEETANLLEAAGENNIQLLQAIARCKAQLQAPGNTFVNFDRSRFLSQYWKPLLQALYRQQLSRKLPFIQQRRAIRTDVPDFLERNAFDPYFFAPDGTRPASRELIALGKALFSEPALSASGRSCAACHKPELAFTDGLKLNHSLQRDEQLQRNTPTVINAALQPVLFADARVAYLEEQAHDVIFNEREMDGNMEHTIKVLSASAAYKELFGRAFPGEKDKMTQERIIIALAAFERSMVRLDAPFDRFMRGDSLAMTLQQQKGFNLFMGKAKCGTCHFMPLFNGAVPPFYDRQDTEIIGVPATAHVLHPALDGDLGVYQLFRFPVKKGAFKTPTLRNAARTAPYMHNGVYPTLEEVIEFYDKGGGTGLGIAMKQQTLPSGSLQLTHDEKAALVAFIQTLSDE
jgi:cytochrome c peroxidase